MTVLRWTTIVHIDKSLIVLPSTVLLLAVVVHRRRADAWAEKELDDIRENIIAYEDEGGGEGDAGYDLHVLRQMYDGPPDTDAFIQRGRKYFYNVNWFYSLW